LSPTNIFAPASTPAHSIFGLSLFVLAVTGAIFIIVFTLLVYVVLKFRSRVDDGREPPQVYGSNQVELAWTVIPILIVAALFMATARVIADSEQRGQTANAIAVIAIAHQFWWEYRYPGLGDSTGQLGRPQTRNNVQPARRMSKPGTQLAHRFPRTSRKAADSD
jgi:cytochrome c oxidase subunit 2